MKKILFQSVVLLSVLILSIGCDCKQVVDYVSGDEYKNLKKEYEKTVSANRRMRLKNRRLHQEVGALRHEIKLLKVQIEASKTRTQKVKELF